MEACGSALEMVSPGADLVAAVVVLVLFALPGTETPEQPVSQRSEGRNAIRAEMCNKIAKFAQFFGVQTVEQPDMYEPLDGAFKRTLSGRES
jgi:hypothetical protein